MEVDWEFEVGGGAPVIDALWAGWIDLRRQPERLGEIEEAAGFPALAKLLVALNAPASPLWTAKCDLWEPEAEGCDALACYVDLLPVAGQVFALPEQVEAFCRQWTARLEAVELDDCQVELVVRQALVGPVEGLAVTAYVSAEGRDRKEAARRLTAALLQFQQAIPAAEAA
jgi:hypothetical protein